MKPSWIRGVLWFLVILLLGAEGAEASERKVRVGVFRWDPLTIVDAQGTVQGICRDVLDQVAEEEGWSIVYVSGFYSQCLERLRAGQVDLVVGVTSSLGSGSDLVGGKESLYSDWGQIYLGTKGVGGSLFDLEGKTIAVLEGDMLSRGFPETLKAFHINAGFLKVRELETIFKLLQKGEVDAGLVNHLYGEMSWGKYGASRSGIVTTPLEVGFLARKEPSSQALLARLDGRLAELKNDGRSIYYRSIEKWVGVQRTILIPEWLKWLSILLGVLFISSLFLLNQLNVRSDELSQINEELQQEIAQRRQTEGALRVERDFSDALLESVAASLAVFDTSGILVRANRRFLEHLHPADPQHPWKFWDIGFWGDEEGRMAKLFFEGTGAGDAVSFPRFLSGTLRTLSGDRRDMGWYNTEIRGGGGRIRYLICTGIDVTDQVRAEQELRRSEERYRMLFDNLQQVFFRCDEEGRFELLSPSVEHLLDRRHEEIMVRSLGELFADPDRYEEWRSALERRGYVEDFDAQLLRRRGEPLWCLVSARRVRGSDVSPVACEGTIRDYSLQKEAEEALKEREELKKGLKQAHAQIILSQLNPHFLFNTLNTIARLALSEGAEQTEEITLQFAHYLRYVLRKQSRDELIPLRLEIESIRDYLAIFAVRFGERLRVEVECNEEALGCRVPFMILQPLVENSVIHGLEPSPHPMLIRVSGIKKRGRLMLEVRDDGPGFDPDETSYGKGFYAVTERLRQFYEDRASLVLESRPGGGAVARLELPCEGGMGNR